MDGSMERSYEKAHDVLAREAAAIGSSMKIRFYPLVVASSSGTRITDVDGNDYLDFIASGGVAQLGYGNPQVRAAITAELDSAWTTMHCCYPHPGAVELAEALCELFPADFDTRAWFGTTGSDANDCLAKLLPPATGRQRLVSFVGSYHGQTAGSAGLSGHGAQAAVVGSGNVTKVPYPDPYRCSWGPCERDGCSLKCLEFIDEFAFQSVSPGHDTAAVIMEPVQSDGGDVVPPANFIPALRSLCDSYGIWLVFDEVKTGMGRTGTMFAFEAADVVADAVSLGKPLGGGLPLSAVVGRAELLDQEILALYTLGGSPVPTAAGLAVLHALQQDSVLDNARARGAELLAGLTSMMADHPLVGDVRGRGLILGVELVTDRSTREPAAREAARVAYRCFELGLLVIYCGRFSNVIELTPPLTITSDDVQEMLAKLDQALTDIEAGRFDDSKLEPYAGW
jgi:4-aminobutyrate aminotransferase